MMPDGPLPVALLWHETCALLALPTWHDTLIGDERDGDT